MKRNNLLMLSFIVLMIVCVVTKSFWDYPMWPTIVAAITVASWIFAIADLFLSQSTSLTKIADDQLGNTQAALDEVKMIQKSVDVRITQLEKKISQAPGADSPIKLHTDQDELNHVVSVKTDIQEIERLLQSYNERLTKGQKTAHKNHIAGCILTVTGFLAFFTIVIFKPLQANPVKNLDQMTVWAFCIILLTQYLETWLEERRNDQKKQSEKCVNGLDALRRSFESEVVHNSK